jgi:CDP-4-dehydro-6-deoxyglucose reductase
VCRTRVLSGASTELSSEVALTSAERADGWILSCVRSATTAMSLEVEDLGSFSIPETKILPCRISERQLLAPQVMRVILRLPPSSNFRFLPGQYINVTSPNGVRRSYSLANADAVSNFLELHVRAVENGAMSDYWFNQAKVNDLLRLNGPLGTFFLRDVTDKDVVFLATGTGIAPVKSMLEAMWANLGLEHQPRSVKVFWGGRVQTDHYWNPEFPSGRDKFVKVLSRPSEDWSGARGYVQQVFMSGNPDLRNMVVYACGSNDMILSSRELLLQAGLPGRQFFSDAFVCSAVN